jgi:ssDNA-binding Zn-finger/Zn-ribbon topoisomerase 1
MEEGRIVRLGRIADDKLETKYADYVTVDGIVRRRSAGLEARKCEIEEEIARLDARTEDSRRTVELFTLLDHSEAEVARLKKIVNDAAAEGRLLKAAHGELQSKVTGLEAELQERKKAFFGFLKRSEAAIQRDLDAARRELEAYPGKIEKALQHYRQLRASFENAQAELDRRRRSVERKDRATATQVIENAEEQRDPLVAELREIEAKIVALRDTIMREAKTLGATCTKSSMSAKDIGQVDLVIVDEASMVILPMIWFSAGLSRERVVVCGDFRQIAPIVQTEKQAVFDVLGNDVFTEIGMADAPESDPRLVMLDTQYRMRSPICNLISGPMYNNKLKTQVERDNKEVAPPPYPFDETLTIIDTSDLWPFESQNAFYSRFNLMHTLLVRNLAWHFDQKGSIKGVEDLGICTPYAAQAKLIHKLLAGANLDRHMQVGTVHRFQGDEHRIVVLEVPEGHGGAGYIGQFIQGVPPSHTGARLMNVAVSRARDHLIVMANLTYLDRRLPGTSLLRSILYDMQERGRVIMGRELLELRPIASDLQGLVGKIDLDVDATTFGLFDEKSFDPAFKADILAAKESVVIFSGFITPRRVGEIGDLLRTKVADGVKVRCVTRPPKRNGTMDSTLGKEALDILEGIGCVVDCRANIHQKVVLIDNKVVWHGSLNALSHAHRTEESMTRVVNEGLAQTLAAAMSKRKTSAEKAASAVAEPENPRCPECTSRTVYALAKRGANREFFYCEADCGWWESLWKAEKRDNSRANQASQSDVPNDGPPCPACGAATRLRPGPYGSFYGCMRYPDCKGTVNPDQSAKTKTRSSRRSSGTNRGSRHRGRA